MYGAFPGYIHQLVYNQVSKLSRLAERCEGEQS
jgi:hypothetical protein